MARFYYIGPWVPPVPGDPLRDAYRAPAGSVGMIDLRPTPSTDGYGFFATDAPLADSNYEPFGDASGTRLEALPMSVAQRNKWASMLGIQVTPDAGTLLDLLWNTLTIYSDPDGALRAKPIMPTTGGVLELRMGGHSLVRASRIPSDITSAPHWLQMQRVIHNDYRVVEARAAKGKSQKEKDLNRRWLGFLRDKYRLTDDQASGLLIPDGMTKVRPQKPETTITDDFNRADADPPSNAAAGWSWTEVSGTVWRINTNRVQHSGQILAIRSLRAESDLSGADHYAQVYKETNTYDDAQHYEGPCCRFSSSAETFYTGVWRESPSGTTVVRLYKVVAGTPTQIGSDVGVAGNDNTTVKVEANGSTIKVYYEGAQQISETDTSISDGTRAGIACYYQFLVYLDDFAASDLAAGGATLIHPGMEGLNRHSSLVGGMRG